MSHIKQRIKRYFWAVFGATNTITASCSGSIEQILSFSTTHSFHSFKKSSNKGYNPILSQSPLHTTLNRGFSAVGFETAIGGAA
jgi:hypothetical protein